jgi:putative hemolysin
MDDGGPTVSIIAVGLVVLLVEFVIYIIAKLISDFKNRGKEGSDTEEEIISMVNEGHEQGLIEASEARMINNIFAFGDKQAQDIMTHRSNICAIDGSVSLDEAVCSMLEGSNSRYPVYEENINHILGILHLKDALRFQHESLQQGNNIGNVPVKEIKGLLREAKFIPETRNIDALFRIMQSTKLQMVMVADEYGQTSGLVTMEDILEEIVGNIMDEYDEDEEHIEKTDEDEYVIDGLTPIKELEERFSISFHEEEFETLNGFLISKMDKIPEENDEFEVDVEGYNFKVLSIEHKRIQRVLVTRISAKEKEGEDAVSV